MNHERWMDDGDEDDDDDDDGLPNPRTHVARGVVSFGFRLTLLRTARFVM